MDTRAREILTIGDHLFGLKQDVDSLWQEIALNFYVERADFTDNRSEGDEYSDHLFSSYPVLARRELGNMLSSNLRPQAKRWFNSHHPDVNVDEEEGARQFLEHIDEIQWRSMYDAKSGFVRATKQADHDFSAFGNAVIYGTPNQNIDGLLFRNYHLRDCAWADNSAEMVDEMHRNWSPTARQLKMEFGSKVSKDVVKACDKEPHKEFECRHAVLPTRQYRKMKGNGEEYDFTSLIVERESETVLEEVGIDYFPYVVPRWQTVSNSVYGRSMATGVALPDGRTMQVVVRTLREAGEKYVDPPMIAVADAIRGDIPLYPGGITIADMEYDEKLGEVLRPVSQQSGNMPIGYEIADSLREDIRNAFFLDKLTLPAPGSKEMTAFEVRRRLEEHITAASPLFEPIEQSYSSPLCELAFNILNQMGKFPMQDMPQSLGGANTEFKFRSPISDLTDQSDAATFVDIMQRIVTPAVQLDPAQLENINMTEAIRDAMRKAGWKADWFNPKEAVDEKRAQMAKQAEMAQAMEMAQKGGQALEKGGKGGQALMEALGAAGQMEQQGQEQDNG